MRWVPTIAVVLAPTSWAISAIGRVYDNGSWLAIGDLVPTLCLIAVCYLSLIQPRPLNGTRDAPLDERERGIWMQANLRGMVTIALLGISICFYMSVAGSRGWWIPATEDWAGLGMINCCWMFGMPMVFANWQIPSLIDEEDGE